jgi:hypothetical protein
VRRHGSGGTNNGRSSATRSRKTVIPRSQPIRSAITDVMEPLTECLSVRAFIDSPGMDRTWRTSE